MTSFNPDDFKHNDSGIIDLYSARVGAIEYIDTEGKSKWSFILEVHPYGIDDDKIHEFLQNNNPVTVPMITYVPQQIVSRSQWPHYSYALEHGMEVLELLGEKITPETVYDLWFFDEESGEHDCMMVMYDGDKFYEVEE